MRNALPGEPTHGWAEAAPEAGLQLQIRALTQIGWANKGRSCNFPSGQITPGENPAMRSSPRGTPGSERAHRVPPGREPAVTAALSPGPARGCRRPRSGPRCCPSAAGPRDRADTAARSCGPGQRRPQRERQQLWNNRNNRNNRDNRDAPILLGAAAPGPHLRLWRKHRRTAQPREGDDAGPLGRA